MKLSTSKLPKLNGHLLVMLTMALCLICIALAHGASQVKNLRRITALQIGETHDGSRVTVIADSALDDYEAFRRGERFYVKIPFADLGVPQPTLHGQGFEDVQIQKIGSSIVISFRLHPGVSARVAAASNRLDVIFISPGRVESDSNAVRNRLARGTTTGNRIPARRAISRDEAAIAGPMPSDSATTDGQSRLASGARSRTRQADRPDAPPATVSTDRAIPTGTPTTATPYPTASQYSATYPAASTTLTPAGAPPISATDSGSGPFDLRKRGRSAVQWVSANKGASTGIAIGIATLLAVVIFLVHSKRRTGRNARSKTARVQPKYSDDVRLEDALTAIVAAESSKVGPGPYVNEGKYESWDDLAVEGSEFLDDLSTEPSTTVSYKPASLRAFVGDEEESWEFAHQANKKANTYEVRLQEEREVFEL